MPRQNQRNQGGKASQPPAAFMLTQDDDLSPYLITIWACLKGGDVVGALSSFSEMCDEHADEYAENPVEAGAIQGALAIADEMRGDEPE